MIVTLDDADAYADVVLAQTKFDGADAPKARAVAKAWGVPVLRAPASVRWRSLAEWMVVRTPDGEEDRVYVRATVEKDDLEHPIGHELGHIAIRRFGLRVEEDVERWCNRFGAALLCPASAVRNAWRRASGDPGALFERWPTVPPTAVALRIPEVLERPMLVIDGRSARYRFGLADTPRWAIDLAAQAVNDGAAVIDGMARAVRLMDGRRRAAVVLAA